LPRGVGLDPRLLYNCTAPRFGVELPLSVFSGNTFRFFLVF
jgi:hypothetical protein